MVTCDLVVGNTKNMVFRRARALHAELRTRGWEELLPSKEDLYSCPLCLDVVFKVEVFDASDPGTERRACTARLGGWI